MKIFSFDASLATPITAFGSQNVVIKRILLATAETRIDCMVLTPNGTVGYHQAVGDQLFLVVQGQGYARSGEAGEAGESAAIPITAGQAAFWKAGEWHETTSAAGLTAIVIEAEAIDPARFMTELH
jgi:quercetin dioxygenase-like cupin family protein